MKEWLGDLSEWLSAVFKIWWGWLPASAITVFLSLVAGMHGWHSRAYNYAIGLIGFAYSAFVVWRKERTPNKTGRKSNRE
jgi:hypothetical protein